MGSVKKKLTKTLRKITPKEIAPILPFVAMAIPGMQGIGMAMRYALPQLLTAAASARQSGDISLMNQALALAGSYAAGPGGAGSSTGQKAFMDDTLMGGVNPGAVGSPGALAAQQGAAATTNLAAGKLAYTPGMTGAQFAQANPEQYASFMKANPNVKNTFVDSFRENILQPANEGLNNQFSKKGLMTIGGAGATMATSDYAKRKENEMDQENAERMGFITDYYDATEAMKDYFVNQDYTLEDVYGKGNVPSFLLANGGRVKLSGGGMSDIDNLLMDLLLTDLSGGGGPNYPTSDEYHDMDGFEVVRGLKADGGRVNKNMGGIMNAGSIPQTPMVPQGMQLDGRGGGFIPMGAQEKKDDVPAMLAKNEFVMTSDAVRAAGGGSVEKGAQKMYDLMNQLEAQA
tara:strand:+ start:2498 stop:3703 length:1206 start_codon:yes stop_codon:yes gene_type:complete